MKKYIIKFAQLTLFFGICAPNMVMSMETNVPALPADVCKLILTKTLRLVLDEVEDDPHQLMARKKLNALSGFFAQYITGRASERYESTNNIDYILKLIMAKDIGVDSNIKNYKGNTVLHLLISEFLQTQYQGEDDSELKFLRMKIELLSKCGLDFNAKNGKGTTIGHELIASYVDQGYFGYYIFVFITFLQSLGMTVSTIKNDDGLTACQMGKILNKKRVHVDELELVQIRLDGLLAKDMLNIINEQMKMLSLEK